MMDQEPTADQAQENAREPSPEAIAYAEQVFGDAYKSEYSGHIALVEDAFDAGREFANESNPVSWYGQALIRATDDTEAGKPVSWSVHRPSERERIGGSPDFVVILTGTCWHDVERNLADARTKLGFTAPEDHNPDQLVHASPEAVQDDYRRRAKHVGTWDGPFTVERREDSNVGNHYAVVSQSGDFAMVFDEDCIGAELGTKARATRIAEALNRTRKTLPQSCTLVALRDAGLWAEANAAVTGLHEDDRARLGLLAEFVRVNLPNMGGPHD